MELELAGQVAVVTGASKGIGLAVVRGLAASGAPSRTGGFLSIIDEDWTAALTLNLMAAVRSTRAALPAMIAAGHGAIVNTCSAKSRLPDPAVLDYSAAKAALAGFSKALSKEVGPQGIRVNTVSPGPVATDPLAWPGRSGRDRRRGHWPRSARGSQPRGAPDGHGAVHDA
jgi:NAD(P)-dependent dehydrogenase (short-subunit alcohol dehydrogenase family)